MKRTYLSLPLAAAVMAALQGLPPLAASMLQPQVAPPPPVPTAPAATPAAEQPSWGGSRIVALEVVPYQP